MGQSPYPVGRDVIQVGGGRTELNGRTLSWGHRESPGMGRIVHTLAPRSARNEVFSVKVGEVHGGVNAVGRVGFPCTDRKNVSFLHRSANPFLNKM